jgi:pilus assembly protein CpaE
LTKPPTIDELMAAIERAGAIAKDERTKTTTLNGSMGTHFGKGKIITIYSPKGGSGCTMLASNLAAALYNQETPVALIDGNFQFGDLAVFFNVMGKNSLLDLTSRVEDLDPQLVEEVMIEHSSGIKLLAPPPMGAGDGITSVEFAKLLNYLSYLYPYVLIDASHWLTDTTLAAFDASDLVVLITTQDIPCIARARKFLDLAPLINLDRRSNILVVMNQYDKRIGISPEKIGEVLKLEVSAVLPLESGVVIPSINRGVPFMLQKDMLSRPIARSTLDMIEAIRQRIARLEQMAAASEQAA